MIKLYNQNIWGNTKMPIGDRNRMILSLVNDYTPDFCALQECNPRTSRAGDDPMQELLGEYYAEAAPDKWNENFTPLFYRKDAWKLIDSGFLPYDGENDGLSKSVTWGVFERIADGYRVGFASTHFWYKHRGPEDSELRISNARQLKEVCDAAAAKYSVPFVVSGDFNNGFGRDGAPHDNEPYLFMLENGFADVRHKAAVTTDSPTIHSTPEHDENNKYSCDELPSSTIDFIFTYGKHLDCSRFDVLTGHTALSSSDHCPMIAEFDV